MRKSRKRCSRGLKLNSADLARGIRKVWDYAKILKLDEVFSGPTALEASESFKELALSNSANYEEIYLAGLRESQYNILLKDLAYFQFGLGQQGSVRYAYYPNPFLGRSDAAVKDLSELKDFVEEGILDIDEYLHRISELRRPQHPPLVRYENAPAQHVELIHPCSHFHFGHHSDNRWPIRRVLTPSLFSLLLFKHHYSEFWLSTRDIKIGRNGMSIDELLSKSKKECQILPVELFTDQESKQFYFS